MQQPQIIIQQPEGPKIIPPVSNPPQTPEEAAKGHDTVTMYFEQKVMLTVTHGHRVLYTPGVHEVPREWSNHWWLNNNGARLYNRPMPAMELPAPPKVMAPEIKKFAGKK